MAATSLWTSGSPEGSRSNGVRMTTTPDGRKAGSPVPDGDSESQAAGHGARHRGGWARPDRPAVDRRSSRVHAFVIRHTTHKAQVERWDERIILYFRANYIRLTRIALFVVFFWFGIIKFSDLSPADELAEALAAKTVGAELFDVSFKVIAVLECLIGILILIPSAARIVIPLLFLYMPVVSAPLVLVPEMTWQSFMVPTLEGQYIIKNIVIVAAAFGVAANTQPLIRKRS